MKYFKSLIIITLIAGANISSAQEQANLIKGKITDAESSEPLIGVTVFLKGTTKGGTTDLEGSFAIKNVNEGRHTIVFSYIGYLDTEQEVNVSGGEVDLGNIKMSTGAVMLKEVEISTSIISFDEESKTPTAVSTVNARDIQEQLGGGEFPEMLKSSPGVFASMEGGNLGGGTITVRGFSSQNTAVMINGVPVNDMENGWVYWSNWGGLNDVTRYQQVQRGLGMNKLAVSSIGGTINIITKPTEIQKGLRLSYSAGNASFANRIMATYSTGLMDGDWAVSVAGSRRWGSGYRPGTFADSYAYFISAYKKLGAKHQLVFTGFGAPQVSGSGWDANKSDYIKYGYDYNPSWGWYNGKKLNRAVNQFHKPQFMLNHYFAINDKTNLTNSAYWSFGRGGGTNVQRSYGSSSLNSSTFLYEDGQLNWDKIFSTNEGTLETINNTTEGTIVGARSLYYLEKRRNDHNWYGFISSLRKEITENLNVVAGVDGRYYKGAHFAQVLDLLGGDYIIDKDPFKTASDGEYADMNSNTPTRVARVGDKVRYDYTSTVSWIGLFAQAEYTWKGFDVFLTGNLSNTSYYRDGNFQHEFYADSGITTTGKSDVKSFTNYTVKGGINYRITGRHNVFANAGYFTRAPFFSNAFIDARISNQYMDNITDEKITALEAGYNFRHKYFSSNLNVYYTIRDDWMFVESYFADDLDGFKNFLASGVGAIHKGIELDIKVKPMGSLELTGMISIGDWRWNGNSTAIVRDDNTLGIDTTQTLYVDGLPVGKSAQSTAAIGARYQFPFYAYLGASINFFDNMFMDYDPTMRRYDIAYSSPTELKAFHTIDLYAGKSWKIKKYNSFLKLQLNISNLSDKSYIIGGREDPGGDDYFRFGRPLTYFMSIIYNI